MKVTVHVNNANNINSHTIHEINIAGPGIDLVSFLTGLVNVLQLSYQVILFSIYNPVYTRPLIRIINWFNPVTCS